MAGYIAGTASSSSLEDLNQVLLMGRTGLARSIENISMESDAGIALNTLRNVQRSIGSRGWWFNTDRRVTLTPDENDEINITGAAQATRSRPRPGECPSPEVRLVVPEGSSDGQLWNAEDNSWKFTDYDSVMVDIVRPLDLDALPQEFRDYCVQRAGRMFAFSMGVRIDKELEREAWLALEQAEAEYGEQYNLLENDPQTLATWYR